MFGSSFGAFGTEKCHFFDNGHPAYLRIAAIARIRNQRNEIGLALLRGRQYLRETFFLGRPFSVPARGELAAWSRIPHRPKALVALNTHGSESRGAEVTVDALLHPNGLRMTFLYRSDWSDFQLQNPPLRQTVTVSHRDRRAAVRIDLPPAGMAILA
ncbi:MAG: hypothetical protein IT210_00320 [Armatimonadetes bacterium]|nr:hypothetical protein [Armatimonadota bacterium]